MNKYIVLLYFIIFGYNVCMGMEPKNNIKALTKVVNSYYRKANKLLLKAESIKDANNQQKVYETAYTLLLKIDNETKNYNNLPLSLNKLLSETYCRLGEITYTALEYFQALDWYEKSFEKNQENNLALFGIVAIQSKLLSDSDNLPLERFYEKCLNYSTEALKRHCFTVDQYSIIIANKYIASRHIGMNWFNLNIEDKSNKEKLLKSAECLLYLLELKINNNNEVITFKRNLCYTWLNLGRLLLHTKNTSSFEESLNNCDQAARYCTMALKLINELKQVLKKREEVLIKLTRTNNEVKFKQEQAINKNILGEIIISKHSCKHYLDKSIYKRSTIYIDRGEKKHNKADLTTAIEMLQDLLPKIHEKNVNFKNEVYTALSIAKSSRALLLYEENTPDTISQADKDVDFAIEHGNTASKADAYLSKAKYHVRFRDDQTNMELAKEYLNKIDISKAEPDYAKQIDEVMTLANLNLARIYLDAIISQPEKQPSPETMALIEGYVDKGITSSNISISFQAKLLKALILLGMANFESAQESLSMLQTLKCDPMWNEVPLGPALLVKAYDICANYEIANCNYVKAIEYIKQACNLGDIGSAERVILLTIKSVYSLQEVQELLEFIDKTLPKSLHPEKLIKVREKAIRKQAKFSAMDKNNQKNLENAIEYFTSETNKKGDSFYLNQAYFNLALIYYYQKTTQGYIQALSLYQKALSIESKSNPQIAQNFKQTLEAYFEQQTTDIKNKEFKTIKSLINTIEGILDKWPNYFSADEYQAWCNKFAQIHYSQARKIIENYVRARKNKKLALEQVKQLLNYAKEQGSPELQLEASYQHACVLTYVHNYKEAFETLKPLVEAGHEKSEKLYSSIWDKVNISESKPETKEKQKDKDIKKLFKTLTLNEETEKSEPALTEETVSDPIQIDQEESYDKLPNLIEDDSFNLGISLACKNLASKNMSTNNLDIYQAKDFIYTRSGNFSIAYGIKLLNESAIAGNLEALLELASIYFSPLYLARKQKSDLNKIKQILIWSLYDQNVMIRKEFKKLYIKDNTKGNSLLLGASYAYFDFIRKQCSQDTTSEQSYYSSIAQHQCDILEESKKLAIPLDDFVDSNSDQRQDFMSIDNNSIMEDKASQEIHKWMESNF